MRALNWCLLIANMKIKVTQKSGQCGLASFNLV